MMDVIGKLMACQKPSYLGSSRPRHKHLGWNYTRNSVQADSSLSLSVTYKGILGAKHCARC